MPLQLLTVEDEEVRAERRLKERKADFEGVTYIVDPETIGEVYENRRYEESMFEQGERVEPETLWREVFSIWISRFLTTQFHMFDKRY